MAHQTERNAVCLSGRRSDRRRFVRGLAGGFAAIVVISRPLGVLATEAATPAAASPGAVASPAATPGTAASPGATPGAAGQMRVAIEIPIPTSPLGGQLNWLLATVNGGAKTLTVAEAQAHIAPAFQATLPPAKFVTFLQQAANQLAPVTFVGFSPYPGLLSGTAVLRAKDGSLLLLTVGVVGTSPYPIDEFEVQAFTPPSPPPPVSSWSQLDPALAKIAPQAGLLAAEIVNDKLNPIHAVNADQAFALGSTFKLWVLGELGHQVQAGKIQWDQSLAIRDGWKSPFEGDFMGFPAGTTFPIRTYADQMISTSDDTATDHLLFTLGRANVQAFQVTMGNTHSARNDPFLATRELAALKVAVPSDKVQAYLAASPAERLKLLASEVDPAVVTPAEVEAFTTPRYVDSIEWFASPSDIGAALIQLKTMAAQTASAPIADIMALNPGLLFDTRTWPYIGYKGGSEPGVLTLNWLLRRRDDRWFTLSIMLNNTSQNINEQPAVVLADQAVSLLASTE